MTIPDRVGKYRVEHVLGAGAMGIVYKGFDERIERPVAIKTLQPAALQNLAANASLLKRFATEVRSAGRCVHPNIVTVFDYVEDNGAPFIIMEYVPSGTLELVIKSGDRLPVQQVCQIMDQILLALDHAHSKGVVHRDIKPSNILCNTASSIKVADFGISQIASLDATQTGQPALLGTPNYMAPERFMGRADDARGDLYSAGIVLFQLLTSRLPFQAGDTYELVYKRMNEPPQTLQTYNAGLSDAWEQTVAQALARNPDERFQTAREFRDAVLRNIKATSSDTSPSLDLTIYTGETRVAEPGALTGSSIRDRLTDETLAKLERLLTRSLGPVSKIIVRRAASETTDIHQLLSRLSTSIDSDAEAALFRKEAETFLLEDRGIAGAQLAQTIGPVELAAVTEALKPYLGPVTKHLVQRIAKSTIALDDFYSRMGVELKNDSERSALQRVRAQFAATKA